ncbi:TonB-dependent receptor [Echinicola marina]|uniref:TonB-dependent receptor n=1 Tax=Echinicola marina TaxID=2859768 RepID=UPI001CF658E3|nr:TonB-dependent receptor [Echinicola marina]UCS91652.1 TonB-dependent receptor [Echinicola marina]
MTEIGKQSGYEFICSVSYLKQANPVTIQVKDKGIEEVLESVFENQPFKYVLDERTIIVQPKAVKLPLFNPSQTLIRQDTVITGKVMDSLSVSLPGATVRLKGTNIGTVTDLDGNFRLKVPDSKGILVISFVSFEPKEISIGSGLYKEVRLRESKNALNEVVVVGYSEQKKISVTGAISSIGTKELLQSPVANVSNMLAGRLPGLVAVQRSGEPGADGSTLKIRGIGTLYEGEESDPLVMVDGIERKDFNSIDPNEIETISILKDASSTAIYGIRGANGVILITTKRGLSGPPRVSFTANTAVQMAVAPPGTVNAYEYVTLRNEAARNDGIAEENLPFSPDEVELYRTGEDPILHPDVDWYDMLIKPYSLQSQYNLGIRGGNEFAKYFVSLGLFDQNAAYRFNDYNEFNTNAKYRRYNFRSNLDFNITKRFTVRVNLASQIANSNYPGLSSSDLWSKAQGSNPIVSPGMVDGRIVVLGTATSSPLSELLGQGYRNNFNSNINSSVTLEHKLDFVTPGLSVGGTMAYDSWYSHNISRSKPIVIYTALPDPENPDNILYIPRGEDGVLGYSQGFGKRRKVYAELKLNYSRQFGDNYFTGLILYNQSKEHDPGFQYKVPRGLQGVVGRLTYSYKNKYNLEFNMGYNGSENFPKDNRFGFFPAYSAGWVVSEENFFSKNGLISFLKFRGSFGEVGNDKLQGNRFLYLPDAYFYSGSYYFGEAGSTKSGYQRSYEGKLGNPLLTWERAKKLDIGIEINFLNDRISLTGDYFKERRNNILAPRLSVPGIVAADLPAFNLGKVNNEGFEVEGSYRSNANNTLTYWLKGNYALAKNKIIFKDEPPKTYSYQNETGNIVGQFFGLEADGLFNSWEEVNDPDRPVSSYAPNSIQPGDIRYIDQNDDGIIDADDYVPIGHSRFPQNSFGLSFGGAFKGFDFSILFQGASKVSTYLTDQAVWPFLNGSSNAKEIHLERWTQERYDNGEKISFPRLSRSSTAGGNNYAPVSSYWLKDASYVRLKNAEIGYNFSGELLEKFHIRSARVYVNGINLFTWSKIGIFDPEIPSGNGRGYPVQRVFNLGANFQF